MPDSRKKTLKNKPKPKSPESPSLSPPPLTDSGK